DELEVRLQNLVQQQERLRNHLRRELLPETPLKKLPHVNDIFIQELYSHLDGLLINPDFSVDALARSMNMSQRTLNRKLKAILNTTPVEFIRRYRLQKAAVMLSSGHNISEAAYSVGFDTASYFTQCFKDEFGKTPTEFLNQKTA
ncbi:MAG TPA: helix-turn-helix transcriptional regulator, partial [Chitinophagaceae bacterium]